MTDPVEFVVKKLPYDLSIHGGLALVGRLFKRINLPAMVGSMPFCVELDNISDTGVPAQLLAAAPAAAG